MIEEHNFLPLWQRLIVTMLVILAISLFVGYVWKRTLLFPMPGYLAGVVGGLAAVPTWELLKRIRPSARHA